MGDFSLHFFLTLEVSYRLKHKFFFISFYVRIKRVKGNIINLEKITHHYSCRWKYLSDNLLLVAPSFWLQNILLSCHAKDITHIMWYTFSCWWQNQFGYQVFSDWKEKLIRYGTERNYCHHFFFQKQILKTIIWYYNVWRKSKIFC